MTEEEKKAIVLLTELRGLYEATAEDYKFRGTLSIQVDEDDSDAIEIILNLIDKQQKEIEELKKPKFIINAETGEVTKIHNDYISKDKIRDILLKFQNKYSPYLETTDRLFIGKEVVEYGEDILDEIAAELDIKLLEE